MNVYFIAFHLHISSAVAFKENQDRGTPILRAEIDFQNVQVQKLCQNFVKNSLKNCSKHSPLKLAKIKCVPYFRK